MISDDFESVDSMDTKDTMDQLHLIQKFQFQIFLILMNFLAVRMKGKGRSWCPSGARHMAKVRELLVNQEIQR